MKEKMKAKKKKYKLTKINNNDKLFIHSRYKPITHKHMNVKGRKKEK